MGNAELKLKTLKIEYEFKLKNMEYTLGLDEKETEPDMGYILMQRAGILLVKEFLKDLNA